MIVMFVVGCAGAIGAVSRYLIDGAVQDRSRGVLPIGTMTVNVIGSLVMGIVTGVVLFHGGSETAMAIVGTGFCGGLTTWSTASWETVRLIEENEFAAGLLNSVGGMAVSVAAAGVGVAVLALM